MRRVAAARLRALLRDRRGISLILVLLLTVSVAALALGGILMASGARLTTRYRASEAAADAIAAAGLAFARDSLARSPLGVLPSANLFDTLQLDASVRDAAGREIPGYVRSVFVGPTGGRLGGPATAGMAGGGYASVLSIVRDARGPVAARRMLIQREPWSRYALALDAWRASGPTITCGDWFGGPVHANRSLLPTAGTCPAGSTGFLGPITIGDSIFTPPTGAVVRGGVTVRAPRLQWPAPARFATLRAAAQAADAPNGDYDILADSSAATRTRPTVRIEFVTVDLDRNGTIGPAEGFMRVFQAVSTGDTALAYVSARRWPRIPPLVPFRSTAGRYVTAGTDPNILSPNCGGRTGGTFATAADLWAATPGADSVKRNAVRAALASAGRRCFLGGDPRLLPAFTGDTLTPDSTLTAPYGRWLRRRAGALAAAQAVRPGDAQYLIPLGANPAFGGVIHVRGHVAVSGRLRGRVTLVATGNVLLADDLAYVTPPGTDCTAQGDILGIVAGSSVIVQDNNLQTPFAVDSTFFGLFDDTPSENVNGFLLALQDYFGEGAATPPYDLSTGPRHAASMNAERCGIAPAGCLRLTGGVAAASRDSTLGGSRWGWAESAAYDACGALNPPPLFPGTGRIVELRQYEVDPLWLARIGLDSLYRGLRAQ